MTKDNQVKISLTVSSEEARSHLVELTYAFRKMLLEEIGKLIDLETGQTARQICERLPAEAQDLAPYIDLAFYQLSERLVYAIEESLNEE
jgi:hypothetical protein